MSIETKRFESGRPGKRLVIFGAIHGNEHCGPRAIERVSARIESGDLTLARGSVIFVPVCNPEAYARNQRFFETNLNRVFRKSSTPKSYEERMANELCALLEAEADILVDIHSMSAPGPVCVFVDHPTAVTEALAESVSPEYVILDWPLVYENDPLARNAQCTSDFAHALGIPSITIECGQHDDPASADVAERSIVRAMQHTGVLDTETSEPPKPRRIRMRALYTKNAPGDALVSEWKNFEPIARGTTIVTRENGEKIIADEDLLMFLPKYSAKPGEEWFYTAAEE